MPKRSRLSLAAAGGVCLLITGCGIPYHISEAPACTRYIGIPMWGGCFGTTIVRDVTLEPASDCVRITANNCNGGTLVVRNRCEATLRFGEVVFPPASGLDTVRDDNGNWIAVENGSNFTCEVVEQDTRVTLTGYLGDQPVTLSFTKSEPLCKREETLQGYSEECRIPSDD